MLYIFLCLRYKYEKKKKFTLKIYFIDNLKKYEFLCSRWKFKNNTYKKMINV